MAKEYDDGTLAVELKDGSMGKKVERDKDGIEKVMTGKDYAGDAAGQFIYGLVTNIFVAAVVYTAIAIPYYTMINYEIKSQEERGKIGSTRGLLEYLVTQIIWIVLIPSTNLLGGNQSSVIQRQACA